MRSYLKTENVEPQPLNQSSDDVEPMPAWVLHDLRRTTVTGMAELGVQPHVIEAVVNHVSGHKAGVAGVYNRATYAVEKREALERWSISYRIDRGHGR